MVFRLYVFTNSVILNYSSTRAYTSIAVMVGYNRKPRLLQAFINGSGRVTMTEAQRESHMVQGDICLVIFPTAITPAYCPGT